MDKSQKSPLLTVRHLQAAYGEKKALLDCNFNLEQGRTLVIVGESGSGKSTLLKTVLGLGISGARLQGTLEFRGRNLLEMPENERRALRGSTIAMAWQNAGASFCPIRRLDIQITESIQAQADWKQQEIIRRAEELMEKLSLPRSVWKAYPFELSGGMQQRAGLLSALMLRPALLLADEPTSALDTVTRVQVVRELAALQESEGTALMLVTHHMGVAWRLADEVLVLKRGEQVEYGAREEIFRAPQQEYTRSLIDAALPQRLKGSA